MLANLLGFRLPTITIRMNEQQQQFLWGELSEKWWRENGAACRATEQQIRYACARHQGANKSKAATLAGYRGSPEALRSAGVRAEGTKAVDDLLTLAAAAEDGGLKDGPATPEEIDRKLTKLIRSPDGAISLKAIEAQERREERKRSRAPPDTVGDPATTLRRMLTIAPSRFDVWFVGATFLNFVDRHGPRMDIAASIPLFTEFAPYISKQCHPVWELILTCLDNDTRAKAERFAAAEPIPLDVIIGDRKASKVNGAAAAQPIIDDEGGGDGDAAVLYG